MSLVLCLNEVYGKTMLGTAGFVNVIVCPASPYRRLRTSAAPLSALPWFEG